MKLQPLTNVKNLTSVYRAPDTPGTLRAHTTQTIAARSLVKLNAGVFTDVLKGVRRQTAEGSGDMLFEEAESERDNLQPDRDSIGEMAQMDSLQLQQLMEKKAQLESMISNVMKAAASTRNKLANNLKS